MKNGEKPVANPFVMLREEFDDWAVLFNPDTGRGFGLNPMGVYLWKLLDGEHSINDMGKALRRDGKEDVPQDARAHILAFIEELVEQGLATYDAEQAHHDGGGLSPCSTDLSGKAADAMKFAYEPPKLVDLSGRQACGSTDPDGNCTTNGSNAYNCCTNGGGAANPHGGGCGSGSTDFCCSPTGCGFTLYNGVGCGCGHCANSCMGTGTSPAYGSPDASCSGGYGNCFSCSATGTYVG